MSERLVSTRRDGAVLTLTIDRAPVRNALNERVMIELREELIRAQQDRDLRAIVVTGAGDRAFCAGGDLKPGAQTFAYDASIPTTVYADLLRTATSCTIPLIARVNGHCLAGGMGILTMCDMAVSTSDAKFGLPEVKIGMFPMQVAALLQYIVPRRKFDEMCITGEPITAQEALEIGLLNYVVERGQLDEKVAWLVERTINKSPTAIRRGKYALQATREMTLPQALSYMEGQIVSLALTEDSQEGRAAFNEKRDPVWTGR
jgi:enoyl-CoA hydratase/carnithine racemase